MNGKAGPGIELQDQGALTGIKDNICSKIPQVGNLVTATGQSEKFLPVRDMKINQILIPVSLDVTEPIKQSGEGAALYWFRVYDFY